MVQAVTMSEVRLLIESGSLISQLKFIEVRYKRKKGYRIEFFLEDEGNILELILITTRNKPHCWADLNRAVRFSRHLFPDVSVIQMILSG